MCMRASWWWRTSASSRCTCGSNWCKLGYEVPGLAASGEQALRLVAAARPDLILMDIHIEGDLDGIETAARLPADDHIPVVYLTAYSEEATLERARATRPYGYLLKPFSERELHATIQMAVERRKVEVALRESEAHLGLALDAAGMASWELDAETRRIVRTGRVGRLFDCPGDDVNDAWECALVQVPDDDWALLERTYEGLLEENAACQVEFRRVDGDGGVHWLRAQGRSIPAEAERPRRIIGVVQDVTEQRMAEERRRQAATVFETTREGLLILAPDLTVVTANPGYCAMTGYAEAAVLGQRFSLAGPAEALPEDLVAALETSGRWRGEVRGRSRDGQVLPLLVNVAAVRDHQDAVTHYVAACSDLTAIRKAEDELQHLAYHDPLTGLPNRRSLVTASAMPWRVPSARTPPGRGAVRRPRQVQGHQRHPRPQGRRRGVAGRSPRASRRDPVEDTVARLGGDEFVVHASKAWSGPRMPASIAEKMSAAVGAADPGRRPRTARTAARSASACSPRTATTSDP